MPLRESYVLQALAAVSGGASVDVIGEPGSGRSHLLRTISDHFMSLRWRVLEVPGNPATANVAFGALRLAGVAGTNPAESVADITRRLSGGQGLLVCDDWDDIDESTRAVLDSALERTGVPVVAGRLGPPLVMGPRRGAGAMRIELEPLTLPELETALSEAWGAPIDPATLAGVFVHSGGSIGVAAAMLRDAQREGRLLQEAGRIVLDGDPWSAGLSTTAERLLGRLGESDRHLLELVARHGPVPLGTVPRIIPAGTLSSLETRGLLTLLRADGEPAIDVARPALRAALVRRPFTAAFLLVVGDAVRALPETPFSDASPADPDLDPGLALIHRLRLAVASDAWRRRPSRSSAAAVAELLAQTGDMDAAQDMLRRGAELPADERGAIRWAEARAQVLRGAGRFDEALRVMRESTDASLAGLQLRARAATLEFLVRGAVTNDWAAATASGAQVPRAEIERARAIAAFAHGRVQEAAASLPDLWRELPDDRSLHVLACMVDIAEGRPAAAERTALRLVRDAQLAADEDIAHMMAYLATFAAVVRGATARVEQCLEIVREMPCPTPWTAMLRNAIAALALRQCGDAARRLRVDAGPEGGLPGMRAGWWEAAVLQAEGDRAGSAAALSASADDQWSRGARTCAAYAYLYAAELAPSSAAAGTLRERVSSIDGRGVGAAADLLRAWAELDIDTATAALERAGPAVEERASDIWRSFALRAARADLPEAAEAARAEEERSGCGGSRGSAAALLDAMSPRERQVVRMTASGMTQAQIAAELVLSVRTIESHLRRALRRAGPELRAIVDASATRSESARRW